MRQKTILLVIALLVFIALGQMSCSRHAPVNLKVGYIPIADCGQLFLAVEKGYFKDENLNVELIKLPGGAKILEALAAGSVDIGFSNVVSLILAKSAGLDFMAITGGPVEDDAHRESAILVLKNSNINKVEDLVGKKIAVNTRKNIVELTVTAVLEKHGVDPTKVEFVEIPFPQMEKVLELNQVDAIAAYEPFVTFAVRNGKSQIITYNSLEVFPRIEVSTYVVSHSWLDRNREMAEKFSRAISKSTEYALQHPDELRAIVGKYASLTSEQMEGVSLPSFSEKLSANNLQDIAEMVHKRGWISSPLDASTLIHNFEER